MKNFYSERYKKIKYWGSISKEEKFEIIKVFTQVFGGEADSELYDMVYDKLLSGEISTRFLDAIREGVREGKPMILHAEFKD